MKKDCMNCKHNKIVKAQYEDICVTECDKRSEISKLTMDELLDAIQNNTCAFFERVEN